MDELGDQGEELLGVPPRRLVAVRDGERGVEREAVDEDAEPARRDRLRSPQGLGEVEPVVAEEVGLKRVEVLDYEGAEAAASPGSSP